MAIDPNHPKRKECPANLMSLAPFISCIGDPNCSRELLQANLQYLLKWFKVPDVRRVSMLCKLIPTLYPMLGRREPFQVISSNCLFQCDSLTLLKTDMNDLLDFLLAVVGGNNSPHQLALKMFCTLLGTELFSDDAALHMYTTPQIFPPIFKYAKESDAATFLQLACQKPPLYTYLQRHFSIETLVESFLSDTDESVMRSGIVIFDGLPQVHNKELITLYLQALAKREPSSIKSHFSAMLRNKEHLGDLVQPGNVELFENIIGTCLAIEGERKQSLLNSLWRLCLRQDSTSPIQYCLR
jgi:hypothetical protein